MATISCPITVSDLVTEVNDKVNADGTAIETLIASTTNTYTNKTLDSILNYIGANHIHNPIRNTSGVTILKGTVITASSTQTGTDYLEVKPRTTVLEIAVGITHADILNNGVGLAINTGLCVDMVDTSSFVEGTILYPNTSGGLTSTKPTSGMYQACAVVMHSHANQGVLLVEFTEPTYIGSTTQQGYVQLNDTLISNSTVQALTANQGKTLKDLYDALSAEVSRLNASVVLKGTWDASVGTFPSSTNAGESWIVSVSGTVDGISFTVNDRIVAIVDSASSTVYASNWHKLDYTDQVLSVAGKTGTVTLGQTDITDFQAGVESYSINNLVEDITPQLGGDLDLNGKGIPLAINIQTGTTYTAILNDAEKIITLNNASPITMTIPANTSVSFPIGTKLNFMQLGAGTVTIAIDADTLSYDSIFTATLHGQYAVATAVKVSSTQWVLFGNLGIA